MRREGFGVPGSVQFIPRSALFSPPFPRARRFQDSGRVEKERIVPGAPAGALCRPCTGLLHRKPCAGLLNKCR